MSGYLQSATGIVLRSKPFQERDRLVTLLTEEHGKLSGIAKGALHSRRFGAAFDLFTCIDVRYKENPARELVRFDEAKIRHDFLPIRKNLEKITAASYFVDLCLRLTEEHEPVREIFLLLVHFLYLLEQVDLSMEIMRAFEIKLLDRLGFAIDLEKCIECQSDLLQNKQEYIPVIEKGGFLCAACSSGKIASRVQSESLRQLQRLALLKIKELPQQKIQPEIAKELQILLQNFLCYYGPGLHNYKFPSQNFLQELLSENPINSLS